MGRLYKRKKTGDGWTYSQGVDELLEVSRKAGIKPPDTKQKPSKLNRIFGLLSAGETAPLAMELLKGGSVGEALKKQGAASKGRATLQGIGEAPTYSDVLEKAGFKEGFGTKAAGLGLDILLDPTTYFGAGLVGKAGRLGAKGVGATAKIARKVPVLSKGVEALEGTAKVGRELFDPISRLQRGGSSRETATYASEMINKAIKSGRYQEQGLRETVEGLVKKGTKETPDAGKLASQYLESGKTGEITPELKGIADYVDTEFTKMWGEEYSSKLIKSKISDYVPHILTPEAKAFFEKSGQGFTTLPTSLGFAKGRKLEGSILEANATFRETLKKAGAEPFDIFEPDLLKAFATRKKASIRALTMRGLVDDISNTFGKKPEEIGMLGKEFGFLDGVKYVPVPENAIRFFPTLTDAGNEVLAVAKNNRRFVPEGIAEGMKDINKVLINDGSMQSLLKTYDSALSIWKKSVTGIFPAFHGRNAMGGVFNNFIAGVKNPGRYAQAEKLARNSSEIVELGGKKYAYSELLDLMKQKGVIGQQGYIDIFSEVDKVARTGTQSKAGKVADTIFNKAPEKTMNAIETRLRGSLLIDRLAKGDNIDDAVKQVFKYHFDYAPEAFTPFERNVMRRLIPFYCVPDYSEILTKDGWKTVDELEVGDISLTYNIGEDVMEWKPVLEVAVFEHAQNIKTWENKRHKLTFTPEHKWVAEIKDRIHIRPYGIYKYPKKRVLLPSTELNSTHFIKVLSDYKPDADILDSENAILLGWLLTDGYFRFRGNYCEAVIYQSPKKYLEEVKRVAGGKPRKPHPDTGVVCVPVKKDKVEKIKKYLKRDKNKDNWIDVITSMSKESLEAMYGAMMRADGHRGRKQTSFACQLDGVAKTFEILATLLGKRVVRNDRGFYVSERDTLGIKDGKFSEEYYLGRVWCPKTENETWVMKQGNIITITGNTWTRRNIPLQIEQMIAQPGKFAGVGKAQRTLGGDQKDVELLPEYMRRTTPISLGKKDGLSQFLYGAGLPVEDVNKIGTKDLLGMLAPPIKVPLELATKRNFYFEQPLENLNTPPKAFKNVPKPIRALVDYNENTGKVNPTKWHILSSLLGRGIYTADKLADPSTSNTIKILYGLFGIKGKSVDLKEQESWRNKEAYEKLAKLLKQKGELSEFSRYYVPKK